MQLTSGSLVQGSFGTPGNFEVVLTRPLPDGSGEARHYWRETDRPDRRWELGATITYGASGPACLVQVPDTSLHVIVTMPGSIGHFRMDGATKLWHCVTTFAFGATGAGALCRNHDNGNLEAVVLHGSRLVHHWYDIAGWHIGGVITHRATGPAALFQNRNGNLEVLALEGSDVVLYWRDAHDPAGTWKPGGVVTHQATGPAAFVQASHGPADHPNFEAVVPEGDRLRHYWRDHSQPNLPWIPGAVLTWGRGPVRAASITGTHVPDACLDVLAEEGTSVFHYYRTPSMRWRRGTCLRIDEGPIANAGTSQKVRQLTGQFDFPTLAPLHDAAYHRIRGTDLGASFEHRGRYFFLFGDTHWSDGRFEGTRDVMAMADAGTPAATLQLRFQRSCLQVNGPDITMAEYDVPLDGFSHNGQMWAFFTSNHFRDRRVMYRSVLARCLSHDPGREIDDSYQLPLAFVPTTIKFQYEAELSTDAFTNVSVVLVGAGEVRRSHLPASDRALLLWGSGAYRADALVLACLPLDSDAPDIDRIAYFTGVSNGHPNWSPPGRQHEGLAAPLFAPGAIGELSVRWDPGLARWVLLYCTGPEDRAGLSVTLRIARTPWGPWSARRLVLDWGRDAVGVFIHRAGAGDGLHQGDTPYPRDASEPGGAYAPYHLPHLTITECGVITLYYVLSTWNPYQTVLMRHTLTTADVQRLDG